MKGQKKFIKLIREVINLIIKFFKPYGLQDSTLAIPKNVKLMGLKIGIMELGITIIFSYDENIKSSNNKGFLLATI